MGNVIIEHLREPIGRLVSPMYLHKSKRKDGRTYLSLVAAYREGGKKRMRTVESLGYLDKLQELYDDPVAHFRAVCDAANAEAEAAAQAVSVEIHPMQKMRAGEGYRKNYGSAALLAVYNELGVERAIRNATRGSKADYDANAVMRLLTVERILDPGSKRHAWENRDRYFFRTEFSLDDAYRALDVLCACRDRIVSAVNRAVDRMGIRDTTCVFYVTNYYFEVDEPGGLRQKGVSKEHRKSPIVQMGLLQDSGGIPIGYRLFPGNTPDPCTMLPVLEGMKRDYKCQRVIAVGDKGNNCSTNIAALVAGGDGFVYSQSIRGTKTDAETRDWVLSEADYACTCDESGHTTYKVKSRQGYKTVTVEDPDGRKRKVDVDVKYVAFWSEKYQKRARRERQAALDKARKLIASPGALTAALRRGQVRQGDEGRRQDRRAAGGRDRLGVRRGAPGGRGGLRRLLLHRHQRDRDARQRRYRGLQGPMEDRGVLQGHEIGPRDPAGVRVEGGVTCIVFSDTHARGIRIP